MVSCVTGENLNLIKKFLNLVPPARSPMDQEKLAQESTEYHVSFFLPCYLKSLQHVNFANFAIQKKSRN